MATTKISELNPLASGSTCAAAVLPIVNNGVTDKISIDNLRGTLRGASNQGPANAALNGGINNTACRLGDSALGGQNNIVNANFCAQTSDSNYDYVGPVVTSSGSLSTIIGGLYNKIDVKSAKLNQNYPLAPDTILGTVGSCITGSATSAYCGYYGIVGGNLILGGRNHRIGGPKANGNYAIGYSMILGGYNSTISTEESCLDYQSGAYNNAIINSWYSEICRGPGGEDGYLTANTIIGGGSNKIVKCSNSNAGFENTIIGRNGQIINSKGSTVIGRSNTVCGEVEGTIVGGGASIISGSDSACRNSIFGGWGSYLLTNGCYNTIVGGRLNRINNTVNISNAVVLGGSCVTGSVSDAVHLQHLVFKTGVDGIPTTNPNVAGQVWNDAGTLKISAG